MQAQIVLREVAGAPADFINLDELAGAYGDACPDRGSIAFGAYQLEFHAVIACYSMIEQERGRFAYVQEQDADIFVVRAITDGGPAARGERDGIQPGG